MATKALLTSEDFEQIASMPSVLRISPDLIVEVRSPNDSWQYLIDKGQA